MKNKGLSIFMSILGTTFAVFTINCLLLNVIFSIAFNGELLKIEVNLILLAASLIIALVIVFLVNKKNALENFLMIRSVFFGTFIFTLAFFVEFVTFMFLYKENMITYKWSIALVLVTFLFAIAEGLFVQFVKTNNYVIKTLSQLLLTGALYFCVVIGFFNLGKGNSLLPVIAIYVAAFVVISAIILLINFFVKKRKDEKKKYTNQF